MFLLLFCESHPKLVMNEVNTFFILAYFLIQCVFFFLLAFFIAVQTFFTFCFICMLIALGGTAAYVLCFTYDYQVFILQALGWVTLTGGKIIHSLYE